MVSKVLKDRVLFEKAAEQAFRRMLEQTDSNPKAEAIIDRLVRRLVLFMRCAEADGAMTRGRLEACVLKSFENAEMLYYGLTTGELLTVIEMELRNEKSRRRHK